MHRSESGRVFRPSLTRIQVCPTTVNHNLNASRLQVHSDRQPHGLGRTSACYSGCRVLSTVRVNLKVSTKTFKLKPLYSSCHTLATAAPSGEAASWLPWKGKVGQLGCLLYPASRVLGRCPAGLGKPSLLLLSTNLTGVSLLIASVTRNRPGPGRLPRTRRPHSPARAP